MSAAKAATAAHAGEARMPIEAAERMTAVLDAGDDLLRRFRRRAVVARGQLLQRRQRRFAERGQGVPGVSRIES